MDNAIHLMETFDSVLGGLTEVWGDGLILVTSDHGTWKTFRRKHTDANVRACN
jgi:hypothetical protein